MKAEAKPKKVTNTKSTGADLLVNALEDAGVEVIFGYPGGAVLPIYDALYRANASFKHILTRHEQGSIHAAEGYARVTGKPGVVIATSGPGATNLVTGITDAMMDSLPIVVFTGQVAKSVIGTDAFQEADVIGITTPITKHNYQVQDLSDLPRIVKEAFHIASTGRPGPVLVDIPKDIANEINDGPYSSDFYLPGYQPTIEPNPLQIKKLVDAIKEAKKPLILAGAGVLHARAYDELKAFAEKHSLPVTTTLLGLGSFPGEHPLHLGMAGMHGTYAANMAIYNCDLLINFGARFDDRLTGNLKHFAPNARVAHIDIDPAEIGKNVTTQIPIVGDARLALDKLVQEDFETLDFDEWSKELAQNKKDYPLWNNNCGPAIAPQVLVQKIHEHTKGEAILVTDVGQHQMWAAQHYSLSKPNRWVTSGGLGTMGFGFPAAIGAQIGEPSKTVVALVGDGGFQMTLQELAIVKEFNLPVKVVIMNNGALGMVRQWQEAFYEKRYSESLIPTQPDFVKLAESYYLDGYRVDTMDELNEVLEKTMNNNQPVVIDCRVPMEENVYPMIPPGNGIHEMIGVKRP